VLNSYHITNHLYPSKMLFAEISGPSESSVIGMGILSLAIFLFAVLLVIAPLAIWHHVAKRRAEANAQHNQTIAMLKSINDTLADICYAIESHK